MFLGDSLVKVQRLAKSALGELCGVVQTQTGSWSGLADFRSSLVSRMVDTEDSIVSIKGQQVYNSLL